jgi:hypothetical protein
MREFDPLLLVPPLVLGEVKMSEIKRRSTEEWSNYVTTSFEIVFFAKQQYGDGVVKGREGGWVGGGGGAHRYVLWSQDTSFWSQNMKARYKNWHRRGQSLKETKSKPRG